MSTFHGPTINQTALDAFNAALPKRQSRALGPRYSPWGLTHGEVKAMDAMCLDGTIKGTAKKMHLSDFTVNDHLKEVYRKLGVNNKVVACVKFALWRHTEEGQEVPA